MRQYRDGAAFVREVTEKVGHDGFNAVWASAENLPSRCSSDEEFFEALDYSTFYASTVALLPSHSQETNAVVARNRRIGVSMSGIVDWIGKVGSARATRLMRRGYDLVREVNARLAREAGVPASIRVTCVKPSGTVSLIAGVSPGMHYPAFTCSTRRIRVGSHTPIADFLVRSGVPNEPDACSQQTTVFSFPVKNGAARSATEVSAWEQLSLLAMLQREWADNAVSSTTYFHPETEGKQVAHMLAQFAPVTKCISMLPHTPKGKYAQMPYEGVTEEEYRAAKAAMPAIDWSRFSGSDGDQEADKFCSSASCEWRPGAASAAGPSSGLVSVARH